MRSSSATLQRFPKDWSTPSCLARQGPSQREFGRLGRSPLREANLGEDCQVMNAKKWLAFDGRQCVDFLIRGIDLAAQQLNLDAQQTYRCAMEQVAPQGGGDAHDDRVPRRRT
jgi:hypothetical protein